MFYVHMEEWKKLYRKDYDYWGIQFFFKQQKDKADELKYDLTIKVRINSFEHEKEAKSIALPIQISMKRRGHKELVIAHKQAICEENLVAEIKFGADEVQKFISNYKQQIN